MSNIRKYFKSRFPNGLIAEYDFSQLEVIALAYLSDDPVLKSDIRNGVDMHCMNASFLYNTPYDFILKAYKAGDPEWARKRKKAKSPGFLIQYGGGAKTMAKQTGLTESHCQGFIRNYYNRYQIVKLWQDQVQLEVLQSRTIGNTRTKSGKPAGYGEWVSPTGRRYGFNEMDSFRGDPSFSPTQMKNYPVQGLATGDIVPIVVGKMLRVLKNDPKLKDDCLLVNTVHDSIVFDVCHEELLRYADPIIRKTMEDAPAYLKKHFGIDFDLELKVDGDAGKNWLEMKPVKEILA